METGVANRSGDVGETQWRRSRRTNQTNVGEKGRVFMPKPQSAFRSRPPATFPAAPQKRSPHFDTTGRTDMVRWGLPIYSIHLHFLRHGVAETWVSDYPESGSFTAMCAKAHSPSVGHVVAASRSAPNAWRKTSGESAMTSRGCARIAAG